MSRTNNFWPTQIGCFKVFIISTVAGSPLQSFIPEPSNADVISATPELLGFIIFVDVLPSSFAPSFNSA